MKHLLLLTTLFALFVALPAHAEGLADADSTVQIKKTPPRFLSVKGMSGYIIPTNDLIREDRGARWFAAPSVKFGTYASGDSWEDFAYGMPYNGIGVQVFNFPNYKVLGTPISVYFFQGGDLKRFSSDWSLQYELNLGMAFNWKPFDAFDNPDNIAIGSSTNAHVGANVYMRRKLNNRWDLNMGVGLTHFSNGAQRLPNKGINLIAPFLELVYNFNAQPVDYSKREKYTPPPQEKRIDYDLLLTITSRQIWVDTTGTGLPQRTLDRSFKVFGLSYAAMFVNSYKYKWGPSLELVYDESSDVKMWREVNPNDGQYYDRVKLGATLKRFSIGVSMKGELTFDRLSFFVNLGYNLLHGGATYDARFYQIAGTKIYLKDNIFGTFGIRASGFNRAQYLFWSVGYTIKGKPITKKGKYINLLLP